MRSKVVIAVVTNNVATLQDIKNKYNAGYYSVDKGGYTLNKVSNMHIFDADQSVNWNIRKSAEWNQMVDQERARLAKDMRKADEQLHKDVADYLMHAYGFNHSQAVLVEQHVYGDKHSCMYDYFDSIDDVANLVNKVIKA